MKFPFLLSALLILGLSFGCQQSQQTASSSRPTKPLAAVLPLGSPPAATAALPGAAAKTSASVVPPPAPPVLENFEGKPQLSLFPRLGGFRPSRDKALRLSYWRTFLLHLTRTAGVVSTTGSAHRHVFSFRGIQGIPSVGFFSPFAVQPNTTYRVSFSIKTDLPPDAAAGVGVLEFNRFLWVSRQLTQTQSQQFQVGSQPGRQVTGKLDWRSEDFTFTTGPRTRMIHLVLFRDGTSNRKPVLFDDIAIRAAAANPATAKSP